MGLSVFLIVLAGLSVLAAAIGFIIVRASKRPVEMVDYAGRTSVSETNPGGIIAGRITGWVGVGVTVIALASLLACCYNSVPARNVGVETKMGRPVAVLDNGGHWTAPWAKVQPFDATVQTVTVEPTVRLKNNTTAQVDASVQWQIDPNADFLALYNSYRTFDNIEKNVIVRQLSAALNNQFSTFDPLSAIDTKTGASTVNVQEFAQPVGDSLKAAMPAGLVIKNVTLVNVKYSGELENQINAIITAAAQTRVAEQQEQTNAAQSAANKALTAGGGAPTQTIIEQNCLNLLNTAIQKGYALPAGFSCVGGGSGVAIAVK